MTMAPIRKAALAVMLAGGLSACGNEAPDASGSALAMLGQAVGQMTGQGEAAPSAPARSPEQAAAEALRINPGPLILVHFESLGRHQVMAMTGQNGNMRTYMTPAEEALILRDGMLVGTRGLGNDLSVAEPQTDGLVRAGRTGSGQRVMRYFSGDGLERPLSFDCTVNSGPNPGVMIESCEGHGVSFQNNYLPQGGQIAVSRQWIGPALGYITIQTLRP